MNVVVTGASRGLGLGFVRHYLGVGHEVWGCFREVSAGLAGIENPRLHTVRWDVRYRLSSRGLEDAIFPEHVDLLINNAGIYGSTGEDDQSIEGVTETSMREVFDVDCVGPLRVVQQLLPNMVRARGVVANVSSKMGSSGDNTSGGSYAYRAAKAALVIVSKSMAIDLGPRGVRVITLHPGWVRTDMTEHNGLLDVEQSVSGMARVIECVNDYAPGAFVAYDGQVVPF